ncbi:MAG: nuclear transport factor 2 family protein [Bdellovibrionota bacterium]
MKALEVVKNYFEYLRDGNLEGLAEIFDENIVWNQPGSGDLSGIYEGKAQVFKLFNEFISRSGGTFKIDEVKGLMANENLVAATIHFSASRKDKFISMDGVDLMKVEHGKITVVYLF